MTSKSNGNGDCSRSSKIKMDPGFRWDDEQIASAKQQ